MEEKRTLIETFLPVDEISAEAKKEKNGRAPTFELHYWWTRKPLIAAKATVLGALLPDDYDITKFKYLLGLRDNQDKRAFKNDLSLNQIKKLKNIYNDMWGTKTPTIVDPFGGGGSIPFESIRIGCNTVSNDYNPVANLIQKATIEYPVKYGVKLTEDVKYGLQWIFDKSEDELKQYYPKHGNKEVSAYIYAWVVNCPDCGFENPLVGQWWLVRKKNKKYFLNPEIENNKLILKIEKGEKVPASTVTRGKGKCLSCGITIPNEHVKYEILNYEKEKLLAVVLSGKNGKEYELPNESDLKAIQVAKNRLKSEWDQLLKEDLVPLEEMPHDLRRISTKAYLKYWHKLLNPRQKILFATIIKLIREYSEKFEDKEYARAVITYLSFLLAKHVDRNSRSASWDRTAEKIAHVLTARGIPMMWDHVEVNPFIKRGSGTLNSMIGNINKSLAFSVDKLSHMNVDVEITNQSILENDLKSQIIVTDPPYFDDVPYPELSEFFYVFEKRALNKLIKLPNAAPIAEDLSIGGKRTKEEFEHLFNLSCLKMNSMLTDNGILIMYFAHSSVEAWDFVVNALTGANFRITATWPIHTENPNNPIARGNASIMSSIVIVARKRTDEKSGYIEEIKEDVEYHLKNRLKEFWDYGLRGADITVAAMGATLDILTQYSEIKSYTGEMTVKDILELVEVYVVEYILEKFLKTSESLDSPTRFYTYCRLSQLDGMSFDTANLISKSLHMDLNLLESAGIIDSITTGRNKGIKLLKYNERENFEIKTLIDAVQFSMLAYEKGGMREFESVLSDIPYTQVEIFNILESLKHLESGDSEKQIAMQILGKSDDVIPKKGQSTLDD